MINIKTLDQELTDKLHDLSKLELKYDTYLALPSDKASYPFVHIGGTQLVPKQTSSKVLGKLHITVYVWGARNQRRQISLMAETIRVNARQIKLGTRDLKQVVNASGPRIREDNSTGSTLYQAILDLEYNIL